MTIRVLVGSYLSKILLLWYYDNILIENEPSSLSVVSYS